MKEWFIERFLSVWAKETVLKDNRRLHKENEALQQKLRRLEAYIQGMEAGIKAGKKVTIYNRGGEV